MSLLRIIVLFVMAHLGFVSARMTGSLYALANGASTFTVGVMMALFALVPMLIAVRAGRWLDAVGPWRPVASGLALMLGGLLLPALFSYAIADVAPLLVAAALIGTGSTLAMIAVQHVVGERADPDNRAADFSLLALGASVSGFCGPIISGVLIDLAGHRVTFAFFAGVLLLALGWLWINRALFPQHQGPPRSVEPGNTFDLLRQKPVRNVLLATALVSMSWDLQTFMVPVHGSRVGLSAVQIGVVLGSFAAATFTIRLAMPWVSRRFSEWDILTFTLFTGAAAFILFPFFESLLPLMAVAFLLGLGLGAAQPNVMSLLHSRAPEGRVGEALGLRTTIMNSSHVVLPLIFGAFGSILGIAAMFWVMASMLVAGGSAASRPTNRG
jgi:predicted MFS family arabinose efflux permease